VRHFSKELAEVRQFENHPGAKTANANEALAERRRNSNKKPRYTVGPRNISSWNIGLESEPL